MSQAKNIAIIPLRAGSKGIVNKNRKKVLGRPLFTWVLGESIRSKLDTIYVFTDDSVIKDYINTEYNWTDKVVVIERSEESASDTAGTEFGMWELGEKINFDFDNYFLLQATSPLTSFLDINKAISELTEGECDSVLTVVKTHRFIWSKSGESLNYKYLERPRRQDFDGLLIENGAIYGCTKSTFLDTKNRLGGKVNVIEMPEDTLTEIDEPSDLLIIEQLLKKRLSQSKKPLLPIKYVVLDVDGVFTDASVAYTKDGESTKQFSFVDGMGLEILRDNNIQPIVMTSEYSQIVQKRMDKLKIEHVYLGVRDKYSFLNHLSTELGVTRNELAYLGDDINDMANIISVGWGACPENAVMDIKQNADLILNKKGGHGAIREFVEFLVKYNNRI